VAEDDPRLWCGEDDSLEEKVIPQAKFKRVLA
jgi:hypothetical protein